ncbi:histidine phosphatase family protein [Actinoalloteichus spitiensis]|uniref:histidine phosphatase family protein n=1 Tax=Actinoalloteichus spitiensis TaxID=252394 RepID=UPI00037C770B|nr:histidine phosphatase family protein [Actinoalloteichus spitiensis]
MTAGLGRLVLWRHGQTSYNVAHRFQGQLDIELTPTGREQARRAAPVLAGFAPAVFVSSDLRRASETASALSTVTGAEARLDKRLRETHCGQWQGLTHDEVEAGWPGGLREWRAVSTVAPPGGESRVEVAHRASQVVDEVDRELGGSGSEAATALFCAHGGLIVGLTARLLGLPVGQWGALAAVANCNWVVLERSTATGWRLRAYNAGPT